MVDDKNNGANGFTLVLAVVLVLGLLVSWIASKEPKKKAEEPKQPVIIVKNYITIPEQKEKTFKLVSSAQISSKVRAK